MALHEKPPETLTRNQSLVLVELQAAHAPVTAYALLDKLRPQGFKAPLQVYRALDRLMALGHIHKLESINAYMACAHGDGEGHHHGVAGFAICDQCGQVSEFADSAIEHRLEAWARSNGFHAQKSAIELHGQCAACALGEG
jgi:Fur family transcriptional regulator, zinc uptake regulator